MNGEATVDAVLRSIPGWERAKWEPLSGGLTNTSYTVTTGSQKGVLKIDGEERSAPFNTRRDEAKLQKAAAAEGLAPDVIWVSDVAYLTEFIEGDVWSRDSFAIDGRLEMLAIALKRVHALPPSGRTFDAVAAATRYIADIDSPSSDIIERCMNVIVNHRPPPSMCCCHNDLVAENLLSTPELKFLDWEYACDNDPLFDLATVIEHHQLPERQVSRLVDTYFEGNTALWQERLQQNRQLYLALLCLWMAARTDSNAANTARVARRLTTSCS